MRCEADFITPFQINKAYLDQPFVRTDHVTNRSLPSITLVCVCSTYTASNTERTMSLLQDDLRFQKQACKSSNNAVTTQTLTVESRSNKLLIHSPTMSGFSLFFLQPNRARSSHNRNNLSGKSEYLKRIVLSAVTLQIVQVECSSMSSIIQTPPPFIGLKTCETQLHSQFCLE